MKVPTETEEQRCVRCSYIPQTQAGSQAVDDVLSQVRVVRIPHQTDGNDLRGIHQHPADTQHLPTVALMERRSGGERTEVGGGLTASFTRRLTASKPTFVGRLQTGRAEGDEA